MTCKTFMDIVANRLPSDVNRGTRTELHKHSRICPKCARILTENLIEIKGTINNPMVRTKAPAAYRSGS